MVMLGRDRSVKSACREDRGPVGRSSTLFPLDPAALICPLCGTHLLRVSIAGHDNYGRFGVFKTVLGRFWVYSTVFMYA